MPVQNEYTHSVMFGKTEAKQWLVRKKQDIATELMKQFTADISEGVDYNIKLSFDVSVGQVYKHQVYNVVGKLEVS